MLVDLEIWFSRYKKPSCPMNKITRIHKLFATFACLAALFSFAQESKALEGIDPKNMGKGDWIWSISISIAKLNNQVPGVTDIQSLMSYEKNQGMSYVIVKAGTGSTNYPTTGNQFTANLVNQAHKVGLKIFAYTRSYGTDIPGELALATNCLALGADGFVIDAEAEWESSRLGTNGPSRAIQLCSAIKAAYPTRILAHSPLPYVSLHSSFPYKEFGYYCDFVMPQDYWGYIGVTPEQMVTDMDTQFKNWQNSLSGIWTNAIKPLVPIGQADNTNVPASEMTAFANAVLNDPTPATAGGYKGMNWWDAHEHSSNQWPAIAAANIGDPWGVPDVIVDNQAATMVGTWTLGTSSADKYATDYRSKGQGTGAAYLQFTPNITVSGDYKVYEWHPKGSNRTTNAPCIITYDGGSTTVKVNQTLTGGSWVLLGTFPFVAGNSGSVKITDATPDAGQLIMADAVRFAYVIPAPPTPSAMVATASAGPRIDVSWADNATDEFDWIVSRSTTANGPYTDVATLPADSTSYADLSVGANTTYYYVVRSENHAGYSPQSSEASATTDASVADIILDNGAATPSGSWSVGTGSADKFGVDYRFKSQGTGAASFLYSPNIFTAGNYNIYEWHPVGSNRTLGAPHIISYSGGSTTVNVNQQANGGKWNLLGTFNLAVGSSTSVRITDAFADAGQLVMADAIKFSYVPLLTAPLAPSGLTATAVGTSQVNLSWTDNSSNEESFIISRSSSNGGPYTDIATNAAGSTSYSDLPLSEGTSYYYVVRALNAAGSSALSNQGSATTAVGAPSAPSGLNATTVSASQINLSWVDNSGNETSFIVARSATSGGPYTDITTLGANVTSYSNTGLSANTTYYYVVRASNSGGASANSTQDSATTLPNAPGAPTGLSATTVSATQINLNWVDNSSNETGFVVASSTTSGGPYTAVATLGANVTAYSNTGLSANTTYYFVVRAVNTGGTSADSAQASATTLPNAPGAPSALSATTVSASQITLNWADNSSNETSFIVGRSTVSGGSYVDIATLSANAVTYSDTGLSANTTYFYVVRASNTGGDSANSLEDSATTLPLPPAAPTALSASTVSSSQINLSWADNSLNETGFTIARGTVSGGPYTDVATLGANVTGYSNTGLAAATTYYYVVRASNTGGTSANSAQAAATTLPTAPAGPSALAATTVSATQINLSWTDNASNETSFIVARATTSGGPYTDIATLGANVTSYSNTGLSAATTYYYVVRASNTGGTSANSAQASATTLPTAPAAPSALTATAASVSQINLSWADNSSNESSFVVARSTTSGGAYTDIATLGANVTSYSNTGLAAATTYYYVVRASNAGGTSVNSAQASATTLTAAPAAPSSLTATTISTSQINLSWVDNASNETSFILARGTTSGGPYTDIATLGANVTSYSNTGLAASTTYYYVVRASNAGGTSANSAQAMGTTSSPTPPAPSALVATAVSGSQINLTWTDNASNELNFIVARSTSSGGPYSDIATLGANVTSYSNTGLPSNTTYYYVVRSSNGNGSSLNSAQASATTLLTAPAAPSSLVATALDPTSIKLTWLDNSANETSFILARSTVSGGPYTTIATLAANTTAYTNSDLAVATKYYYVVRSSNSGGSSTNTTQATATTPSVTDIIIDNPAATVTGTWSTGTASTDKFGTDYRFKSAGTGASFVTYTPNVTTAGNYQVWEYHPQGSNRASNAPIVVSFNGGSQTVPVNQQINGGKWNLVGTYNFVVGSTGNVKITDNFVGAGLSVMADGIKFVYVP
jgi:hypothetical protein